jgi:hypothetical protein
VSREALIQSLRALARGEHDDLSIGDDAADEIERMAAAKTTAERQRKFRARQEKQKLAEVRGIFANPDDHPDVKEAAAKIARKRARASKRVAP